MTAALATTIPLQPQHRRHDEPEEDWLEFLVWLHTAPRPPLDDALRDLSLRHDWHTRAQAIDGRLSNARTIDARTAARDIAANAVIFLNSELAAKTAESLRNPGHNSTVSELTKLLQLAKELAESAPAPAQDEEETWCDLSGFTQDEVATYAYLCSRAHRRERPR